MYSDVHNQRPKADDFFDVSLTSASELETNVMSKRRVKKNIIRCLLINVHDCIYNLFIYCIHILLHTP